MGNPKARKFQNVSFKKALRLLVAFQFAFLPASNSVAYGDLTFDFGEDGSEIRAGEESGLESDEGNCVGACGDGDRGSSYDYDDNGDVDGGFDRHEGGDSGRDDYARDEGKRYSGDSGANAYQQVASRRESQIWHQYSRKIVTFDRNRGDGLVFVRDEKGNIYYRGADRSSRGGKNNSDIYFEQLTNEPFVKSNDGKSLLRLQALEYCAYEGNCSEKGFKEDWWSYSREPYFEGMTHWEDAVEFGKDRLKLSKAIDRAKADPAIISKPGEMKVLAEVEKLSNDALEELKKNNVREAFEFQIAAESLASSVVDIGLSFTPGVSWVKAAYELVSGTRLIDGRPLSSAERIMAGIEVSMPGVGSLAFAGMKILSRNPVFRMGSSNAAEGVGKISNLLESLKPVRFREGKNLSEIAIIGRSMPEVRDAAARLKAGGIKVRIFDVSQAAKDDLTDALVENGGKFLSYERIPETLAYKENMNWIKAIERDGISVLDVGNPRGIKEKSRFYDDEVLGVFKEVNK